MKVYAMLREELAQDQLLGSQTSAARQWLVEVRTAAGRRTPPASDMCSSS